MFHYNSFVWDLISTLSCSFLCEISFSEFSESCVVQGIFLNKFCFYVVFKILVIFFELSCISTTCLFGISLSFLSSVPALLTFDSTPSTSP